MSPVGLRAAALAAALVLAVLSRGDVVVLALLLGLAAWRPLPAAGVAAALAAAAWRWSSTALEDIAGAQAVLGPSGIVDPPSAAVAAWIGALAIVLASPDLLGARRDEATRQDGIDPRPVVVVLTWLPWLTSGATAALVVAGPAVGGAVWSRGLATAAGTALAAWIGGRQPPRFPRVARERGAAALGLASLVAVAVDAPGLQDVLDVDALVEGAAIAVAAGALAWVAGTALVHHPRVRNLA